jgi:hypothetical protein
VARVVSLQAGGQEEGRLRLPARSHSQQQHRLTGLEGRGEGRGEGAKRCSGEFEFQRAGRYSRVEEEPVPVLGRDSGSEGSAESGIFSLGSGRGDSPGKRLGPGPGPGLGRRAVTQLEIRGRQPSYGSALARSQENLVTVSISSTY